MTRGGAEAAGGELTRPRRVVTGHDEQGRSIIVSDGPAPHLTCPDAMPQLNAGVLWVTDRSPASTVGNGDPAAADLKPPIGPPHGGTLLRADFPPDSAYDDVDVGALLRELNRGQDPRDGAPAASGERHFWFYKTTLDYAIVLEGESWAMLDEGQTCLCPGDVPIQRGTSRSWSNRTDHTTRVAFILIDASDDAA